MKITPNTRRGKTQKNQNKSHAQKPLLSIPTALGYRHMYIRRDPDIGKWSRDCHYVDDLGEKLCRQLKDAYGWEIADER